MIIYEKINEDRSKCCVLSASAWVSLLTNQYEGVKIKVV